MRKLPTIASLARADSAEIHKLWEGLGYYTRVRNLQSAARLVMERHAGKFPTDLAEILALPGIGRYTAGAIGSIAFNQPVPILDGTSFGFSPACLEFAIWCETGRSLVDFGHWRKNWCSRPLAPHADSAGTNHSLETAPR
jgi:hypothetical protein